MPNTPNAQSPLYRIGAVSKATEIPVSTLRIWQTRYGAFTPVKTDGNQRLFAEHDVSKALLLKQLSGAGHGIGSIAGLDLAQLRQLWHPDHQAAAVLAPAQPVCLAVVGLGLANRIESHQFAAVLSQHRIQVTDVLDDLATARNAPLSDKPQVLLVQVNSLQDTVFESIQALMQRQPFAQTIVLYHFAPDRVTSPPALWPRQPSFEADSQECLNKNTEDAHLHSYLRAISGSARSLFENALEKIAQHEGIDLREAHH